MGDGTGTALIAVWLGWGVAGGVGCGVGLTTTTRGAPAVGGVHGSWTVGSASWGFGWAIDGLEHKPDVPMARLAGVPEADPGTACLRAATPEGGYVCTRAGTTTFPGRMSRIIVPTRCDELDRVRGRTGMLAVLSRRVEA